ncbi:MAG: biotin--[acetyl-CoA-carboxylase] ligase [Verrucomicrobiota bacterium]
MRADDPDVLILRALLAEPNRFSSGEELASSLGVSRVAVWKRLENLRKKGFEIEAVKRKGYRLSALPFGLSESGTIAQVPEPCRLLSLNLFEAAASTNEEVFRLLSANTPTPFACITKRQPGGKGRRGRTWSGDLEGNLYLSLGFRPNAIPRRMNLLPIWSGLRLCRRISTITGLDLKLKWPNDLMIDGKKVAGMLAESTLETDRITALVFGIGVNVNMSREEFPAELRETATALSAVSGNTYPLDALAAAAIEEIITAHDECILGVDEDLLSDEWERFACYLQKEVQIQIDDQTTHSGIMVGIDRSGSLLIRNKMGSLRSFRVGDVSLRSGV